MHDLIIFGAGASTGSDANGVPPLGSGLFTELAIYAPNAWGALTQEQKNTLVSDFEAGMELISKENSHALPILQRAMAAYFFKFQPLTTNLYYKLAQKIKSAKWVGAIATLNYERLLEISLIDAGIRPVIGQSSTLDTTELCLPHGACHIFCQGIRASASGVSFSGVGVVFDGPVSVIAEPSAHRNEIESNAVPPVMSYFQPNKETSAGRNFITNQRNRFAQLVTEAKKIVIVGMKLRTHDTHIWEPIKKAGAEILYCSGKTAGVEYQIWSANNRQGKNDTILNGHFSNHFAEITSFLGI